MRKSIIVAIVFLSFALGGFSSVAGASGEQLKVCSLVPWLPGEWEGNREVTGPRDISVPLTVQFKVTEDGTFLIHIAQHNAQLQSGPASMGALIENSLTISFQSNNWPLRLVRPDVLEATFTTYFGGGTFNNYVLLKKKKSFAVC